MAALLTLRFPRWLALTLLGLFAVQYAIPGQVARYLVCAIHASIAVAALARNRRHILPTLTAPFLGISSSAGGSVPVSPPPPRPAGRTEPEVRCVSPVDRPGSGDVARDLDQAGRH